MANTRPRTAVKLYKSATARWLQHSTTPVFLGLLSQFTALSWPVATRGRAQPQYGGVFAQARQRRRLPLSAGPREGYETNLFSRFSSLSHPFFSEFLLPFSYVACFMRFFAAQSGPAVSRRRGRGSWPCHTFNLRQTRS